MVHSTLLCPPLTTVCAVVHRHECVPDICHDAAHIYPQAFARATARRPDPRSHKGRPHFCAACEQYARHRYPLWCSLISLLRLFKSFPRRILSWSSHMMHPLSPSSASPLLQLRDDEASVVRRNALAFGAAAQMLEPC